MLKERKNLSTKSLLKFISNYFNTIKDEERKRGCKFSLKDCLMAGLAIFGLKYPSLLKFEKERKENEPLIGNLERLYNIESTPCDTPGAFPGDLQGPVGVHWGASGESG